MLADILSIVRDGLKQNSKRTLECLLVTRWGGRRHRRWKPSGHALGLGGVGRCIPRTQPWWVCLGTLVDTLRVDSTLDSLDDGKV